MTRFEGTDEVLAAALASGLSYARAGEAAGVSTSTCERRMRDPAFREHVLEARRERAQEAASRIEAMAARAVETLDELLGPDAADAVRFKSAALILATAMERETARDLGGRMERLEETLEALAAEHGGTERGGIRGVA